jgi:tRNA-splicing ligase RtcB (3'-phosphate/5'-hydroxy nucleic acid ligase)
MWLSPGCIPFLFVLLKGIIKMSFKYQVQKVSDNHYILPKLAQMKTEVHAFLSEPLYNSSEENVWIQIANGASYEGVIGAYLMPDTHSGFGVPIGSVLVTDKTIIQASVGYDISCGIVHMKVPGLTAADISGIYVREYWIREVEKRIATGLGTDRPSLMPSFSDKEIEELLRYGAKALDVKSELCERQYIPVDDNTNFKKIQKAYAKVSPQLGSVGSGNHYVEMQCSESGEVWVMIHCGSRGYGHQTATHYFHEGAALRGLADNRREESWLYVDEPLGKEYWNYHNSAANFAIANRHIIVAGVQDALEKVFKKRGEVYYEISHNLIQEETLMLPDGTSKKGFVHRKGATRAFPANHPDLYGTAWQNTGHPCLIPGSMYDGAAILFPSAGAYKSACSVNHGSGRLLPRKQAARTLNQIRVDEEMRDVVREFGGVKVTGIISNCKKIPLDECKHVYKD